MASMWAMQCRLMDRAHKIMDRDNRLFGIINYSNTFALNHVVWVIIIRLMVSNATLNTKRHKCYATRLEKDIHKIDEENKKNGVFEASLCSVNKATNIQEILSLVSKPQLQNTCKYITKEGFSVKMYSLAECFLKKMASMTSVCSKNLIFELLKLASVVAIDVIEGLDIMFHLRRKDKLDPPKKVAFQMLQKDMII